MNDQFQTIEQYVDCPGDIRLKITRINNIIEAMEIKMAASVGQSGYIEMQMDDGQMKVRSTYRSMQDMEAGILALEKLKQRYVNRYNGRSTVLRGGNL